MRAPFAKGAWRKGHGCPEKPCRSVYEMTRTFNLPWRDVCVPSDARVEATYLLSDSNITCSSAAPGEGHGNRLRRRHAPQPSTALNRIFGDGGDVHDAVGDVCSPSQSRGGASAHTERLGRPRSSSWRILRFLDRVWANLTGEDQSRKCPKIKDFGTVSGGLGCKAVRGSLG